MLGLLFYPEKKERNVSPKRRLTFNVLYDIISQKIEIFTVIALRTEYSFIAWKHFRRTHEFTNNKYCCAFYNGLILCAGKVSLGCVYTWARMEKFYVFGDRFTRDVGNQYRVLQHGVMLHDCFVELSVLIWLFLYEETYLILSLMWFWERQMTLVSFLRRLLKFTYFGLQINRGIVPLRSLIATSLWTVTASQHSLWLRRVTGECILWISVMAWETTEIQVYLVLLPFAYIPFCTNWRLMAILCRVSLPAPFCQQHVLTSCVSVTFW
jgi:hypothetical protein